jgi:hypothetical protein
LIKTKFAYLANEPIQTLCKFKRTKCLWN